MADNLKGIPFTTPDEGIDFPQMVKELVYRQAMSLGVGRDHPTFSIDEVYIVTFNYTLGNCKAMVSTSLPDGRYYEVTYNRDKSVAYVDTYIKTHNNEITILKEN